MKNATSYQPKFRLTRGMTKAGMTGSWVYVVWYQNEP